MAQMGSAFSQVAPENRIFSAVNKKRNTNPGTLLEWPVSLAENTIPSFSGAEQLKLIPEVFAEDDDIDIPALRRKEAERAACLYADSTRRAYSSGWRDFESFCRKTGRDSLPALPKTVTLYLTYESTLGLAMSTITRRLVAITNQHRRAGLATPSSNPDVRTVLTSIRRELGSRPKPKAPVSPDDLKSMLETVGNQARDCRDAAVLVLAFASGCRRSELVALDLADVTCEPAGLVLAILRSKTDQQGRGREVGVHRGGHRDTCPVRVLQTWLRARGNWAGPLFTRVLRDGTVTQERLRPRAIARIVKQAAKRAGLDPSLYAGHSLRSGCATAAAEAGADILAIARRLGHASTRTTEKYVRHGSLFAINPLKGVL